MGLDDEPRIDQLGEVLANGVVVEPEMGGELCDVDRTVRVCKVAEDAVPGGVTESLRLLLEARLTWHGESPEGRLR